MADRDERHRNRIEADRKRRQQRGPAARHRRAVRLRNRLLLVAGLVAALVALWIVLTRDATSPAEDGDRAKATREGSVVDPATDAVAIERTPATYRVVYRLEEFTGTKAALSTDKVWVRRPFESRLETWKGAPPGTTKVSTQIGAFAIRRNQSEGADPVVIGVPPSAAPSDIRLLPVLQQAIAAGSLERREVRRVLGRPCQVYRSGQLLSASSFVPATTAEYADSCVDAAGLVLEEVLVVKGEILSRRIAAEIEEDPALPGELFVTDKRTLEVADGGGLVRRMGEGLPPGEFLVFDPATIPAGFERLGRFNVIPSQPENFTDPTREGSRETSFADVFVRGADFLVIDQGGTLQGVDPFLVDPGSPTVDVAPFGPGEVRLSALGLEIRIKRPGGRFLRLRGTLTTDELASVGRRLMATEGTGPLEFLEEPGS